MLEAEKRACRKASMTSKEAHDQCLDMGKVLYKMAQYLQQATDQLRKIEGSVEVATNITLGDGHVQDIPEVIAID